MSLLHILRQWRDEKAREEGVEPYRVFPNATLEALADREPTTLDELLEVKGIKEGKRRRYGKAILAIIKEHSTVKLHRETMDPVASREVAEEVKHQILSVGEFLDGVNLELSGMAARVKGEVSSVDVRERVVYFTLKDSRDDGTLNCLVFRSRYDMLGVSLSIGDEVIVEGVPEVYKPSGRFSLRVGVIELAGEGALKKAYDALKKKLEDEGFFAPEKKRPLPSLVERIALITSSDGAAIGDFTMNLGASGLKVDFYPTAVEGIKAVLEIVEALRYFRQCGKQYDCLVIIRGGGSLESLQAFNNEALVREMTKSSVPILAGIGHEKDITLVSLAADMMVSTPTAAARLIGTPWEEARVFVEHGRTVLIQQGVGVLETTKHELTEYTHHLESWYEKLFARISLLDQQFRERIHLFPFLLATLRERLVEAKRELISSYAAHLKVFRKYVGDTETSLRQHDPERLLALGYSLVRHRGKILRSTEGLVVGDELDIHFGQGGVESKVTKIL